jgi:hypothetical protein
MHKYFFHHHQMFKQWRTNGCNDTWAPNNWFWFGVNEICGNAIGSLIFGVWSLAMAIGFALGIMEASKDELFNDVAWSWCVNE